MRLNLRLRYIGWMLLLLFGSNMVLIASLLGFNLYEAYYLGGSHEEEVEEFFFMMAVLLLLSPALLWGAHVVAGRLLRPLDKVLDTADTIGGGDLEVRIPEIDADPRLVRLAHMLNRAFDRYAEAMRQLESFSVNASHQLRTPLAAIRASAETAICRPQSVEVYEETLSEVLDQTDKLKKVIEQMLLLARIEESAARQFTVIRLCERLREWAEGLRSAADTVGVQLVLVCEGVIEVSGNGVLLREAVMNLLENALAHTAEGGTIKVILQRGADDLVCLRIEDSGPGIAPAERERVFERFYRIDNTTTEGTGLGLAIVRQISALHGGHVRVETSTELGGAAFVIELPAKR